MSKRSKLLLSIMVVAFFMVESSIYAESLSQSENSWVFKEGLPPLPDNWSIFEFFHFRSLQTKQKLAVDVIYKEMLWHLELTFWIPGYKTGDDDALGCMALIEKIYGIRKDAPRR
jgi:hypothetical protein